MKTVYSIVDLLAKTLVGGMQVLPHDAVAIRAFADVIADPQTMVHRHPSDHVLIKLGEIDETGDLPQFSEFVGGPVVVITAAALLASQTPEAKP